MSPGNSEFFSESVLRLTPEMLSSAVPKGGRSECGRSTKERKMSAKKERKWAQKSAKERFRVKIANDQVWELPN